ncbi:MAG TPA: nucleotidyltransferase domain-containing protein [Candidatus Nanoarchaeia archaeon]|nr:nucleotidyltransferase domain-containing protein [Candidatus Nanoarchaeia archaeon]
MEIKIKIIGLLKRLNVFDSVNFIMLYGSHANGKNTPRSDIDISISLKSPRKDRLRVRMALAGELPDIYDIQIFEDLPLQVKMEVLKGRLMYCKDKDDLASQAMQLKKEYEDFLPRYRYYITGVRHAKRASI